MTLPLARMAVIWALAFLSVPPVRICVVPLARQT
jgi:hypothetical protein